MTHVNRRTIMGGVAGVACSLLLPGLTRRASATHNDPDFWPLVPEQPTGIQYGGRYLGCLEGPDQAGNIFFPKGYPGVIRFPVERSGTLTSFRWNMRYNTGKPGENTGYSRGDGGTVRVELRRTVGATPQTAIPDMSSGGLLARTALNNAQTAPLVGSGGNPVWRFITPRYVTAGSTLCLVFEQFHDINWVSINGGWLEAPGPLGLPGSHNGPWYGDVWAGMKGDRVNPWGDRWYYRSVTTPYLNLIYADGTATGTGSGFASSTAIKPIGGPNMVRQRFLVPSFDRVVDGLWMRVWNERGLATQPLHYSVTDAQGTVLAHNALSAALLPPVTFGTDPVRWTFTPFAARVTLRKGAAYTIRLNSAAPGYRVNAVQDYAYLGYNSIDRCVSTIADFSPNSGANWYGWTIPKWDPHRYRGDMRMPMAFRVV